MQTLGARGNLVDQKNKVSQNTVTVQNKLMDAVRSFVRRAKTVPYIGRAVRIASAVWRIPETRQQLLELTNKVISLTNNVVSIEEKIPNFENLTLSVPVALRSLNNRYEFVRRELMFEMRYGARSKKLAEPKSDELHAEPRIISKDKLDTARNNTLRLNLGCGHIALDGYINIDRRDLQDVDIIADLNKLPFESGEVDEIFSAHVLEHFPQEQLRRDLLPYWRSLLKPGGVFCAVVPDADFMIREYCNNNYSYAHLREVMFGSQDYDGDFHFNMFAPEQLSQLLTEAGFADVQFDARGRRNGICFEMAVSARNKTT